MGFKNGTVVNDTLTCVCVCIRTCLCVCMHASVCVATARTISPVSPRLVSQRISCYNPSQPRPNTQTQPQTGFPATPPPLNTASGNCCKPRATMEDTRGARSLRSKPKPSHQGDLAIDPAGLSRNIDHFQYIINTQTT